MKNSRKIRKAVIPAAGLGTRFLPVTKSVPKEMLPIAGKPLIQYAIEEAAASGIDTVVLVLSREKTLLAEYFERDLDLEQHLLRHGRETEAKVLEALSSLVEIRTAWQDSPRGLAHAVGCGRSEVGDEPFVVILPDALIDAQVPCTRQLIDCYERNSGCVIATREVATSEVERFGILDVMPVGQGLRVFQVVGMTERPKPEMVSSHYGIFGRYILEPGIFSCIENLQPGFRGELQLTDALRDYCQRAPVYACCFEGAHYDAGDKFGFVQATIDYALKRPDLAENVRQHLAKLDLVALAL